MIQLELDQKEYHQLLKLVYLAQAIQQDNPEIDLKPTQELIQKITQKVENTSLKSQFNFDPQTQKYTPQEEWEDLILSMKEVYDSETMWNELMMSLTDRDLILEFGEDKIAQFKEQELTEKRVKKMQKYEKEFEQFGLQRLNITPSK